MTWYNVKIIVSNISYDYLSVMQELFCTGVSDEFSELINGKAVKLILNNILATINKLPCNIWVLLKNIVCRFLL